MLLPVLVGFCVSADFGVVAVSFVFGCPAVFGVAVVFVSVCAVGAFAGGLIKQKDSH